MFEPFGIDFGTTNSLASVFDRNEIISLVDTEMGLPHPSVLRYFGGEVIVGREAKKFMNSTEVGASPGFVRSPKMKLRRGSVIDVEGRQIDPIDAVSEVLKHIKEDASIPRGENEPWTIKDAVFTIPVDFGGKERRMLREAAQKADIQVIQFVHEPIAAIYAYFRSKENIAKELAKFEESKILVFDWGGGTLDLTLCTVHGNTISQLSNAGNTEVGGDVFDQKLRNYVRGKHAKQHNLEGDLSEYELSGVAAKLLNQCEFVKIELSNPANDEEYLFIRDYLKDVDSGNNLECEITKAELNNLSREIVEKGLGEIRKLLDSQDLDFNDIALCLATGGMANMPAIQNGLIERFPGRVPKLKNGERIIAEGAAYIAKDATRLKLSKPIELLVANGGGTGSYHILADTEMTLPLLNTIQQVPNTRLFCTDPRDGFATAEITIPKKLGFLSPNDERRTLGNLKVEVDPEAEPLLERLECHLKIDHDYIATINLDSTGRKASAEIEVFDLEFGLSIPTGLGNLHNHDERHPLNTKDETNKVEIAVSNNLGITPIVPLSSSKSNIVQRTNLANLQEGKDRFKEDLWKLVPGDLVKMWRESYFDIRNSFVSEIQKIERNFYTPCSRCKRFISQINAEGPSKFCTSRCKF